MTKSSEHVLLKLLSKELQSLRSVVPSSPNSGGGTSVILDALNYIEEMRNHIEELNSGITAFISPISSDSAHTTCVQQQANTLRESRPAQDAATRVDVTENEGGLDIHISCEKTQGLLVTVMETLERFGLVFMKVDIQCDCRLNVDAIGAQNFEGRKVDAQLLKNVLLRTIVHSSGAGA